jgi:hypothetical protein
VPKPEPSAYWWKPRAELMNGWRPEGSPPLGEAWYGPFNGDACRVHKNLKMVQEDVGP